MTTREVLARLETALRRASGASLGADIRDDDIAMAAWWFVQAELLDLPAFGVAMAVRELERLGNGSHESAPAGNSNARHSAEPSQLIDASRIPGHVALAAAVRQAAEASATSSGAPGGVRAVAIRNVGALGILGSAARELALHGLVGFVIANSPPLVAPWGGTSPALGTNPIAAAAPRVDGSIVVDFSTSSLTVAELTTARTEGSELPAPGGLDADGSPTSDPHLTRALLPASLAGSLTGFAVELLTGVVLGRDWSHGRSALVVAIDPRSFGTDVTATGEEFARSWIGAGGHLPSRFDSLPRTPGQAPARLCVAAGALARL